MAKRIVIRRVKIHRHYTYESAADVLHVTAQTVRAWRALGLPVLDSQKPHLILGHELKHFLEGRTPKARSKLNFDEFYCMSCRAPRTAYGGMADYVPFNTSRGSLLALCGLCETSCNKFISLKMCEQLSKKMTIFIRD